MATSNGLLLLCLALLVAMAAATQFRVGGSMGWTVPTDPNAMSYNRWAERNRFKIGDSLLFVYQPGDSVLQVSRDSYNTCNTSSYIQKFDGGNTVFAFDRSGPYYFISGVEDNCVRKESFVVVVLADRSNLGSSSGPSQPPTVPPTSSSPLSPPPSPSMASPSPSPSEVSPPSPSMASPSPSPSEVSPPSPSMTSPPPSPSEVSPPSPSEATPSPSSTGGMSSPPPSKNGAYSQVVSFLSTFGALLGSLLIL